MGGCHSIFFWALRLCNSASGAVLHKCVSEYLRASVGLEGVGVSNSIVSGMSLRVCVLAFRESVLVTVGSRAEP